MKAKTIMAGVLGVLAVAACGPSEGGGGSTAPGDDSLGTPGYPADSIRTPVLSRDGGVFELDGEPIRPFGLRLANALQSDEITDRLIGAMDEMAAHGIQSFSLTIQGGRHTAGGNSAFNGYAPDGALKPEYRDRLARLLDAAADRRMVPVVVFFYRGRDQELDGDGAVRAAVRNTMRFLRPWRHLWVNIANEPYHSGYDQALLTEADGYRELYRIAKAADPDRVVYASHDTGANDGFVSDTWGRNGEAPPTGGDVCIEYRPGLDAMDRPGVFAASDRDRAKREIEATYRGGGYIFFHAAWHQKADAGGWPRFDKGGAGTEDDPGVAFAWETMRSLGAAQ